MKTMANESVDLVISDPPYKTTARGHAGNSGGMLQKEINKKGKVFEHNEVKIIDYAKEMYRLLKDGTHCYIMTNHVNLINMLNTFTGDLRSEEEKENKDKAYGFHFVKSLIWNKGNKIMGQFYMSQFEYILFFRKGTGIKINNCGTSDILSIPNKKTKGADGKNIHDTEKPVELMKILIGNSSKENDVVLDPFVGVGAVLLGCEEMNRRGIGIELDEQYYNTTNNRLDNHIMVGSLL